VLKDELALERKTNETFGVYLARWLEVSSRLAEFYNSKWMKQCRFDLKIALIREKDFALGGILAMAGKKPHEKSSGRDVAFCFGNSAMKDGSHSLFHTYLVKKLGQLGYFVTFEDEYLTSQRFPLTGQITEPSGFDKIRIRVCRDLGVYIHKDIMAAENDADILAFRLAGRERPPYLKPKK
jgi:hypothetical protein